MSTEPARPVAHLDSFNWLEIERELDERGVAVLPGLLTQFQCEEVQRFYPQADHFRSTVVMARHNFGKGEYKYFSYPLPDIIEKLRTAAYSRLQATANRWNAAMGIDVAFPESHAQFLHRCHQAGQTRPTPLMRATTTACIRICTAITCFRCSWRFCSRNPAKIFLVASLC